METFRLGPRVRKGLAPSAPRRESRFAQALTRRQANHQQIARDIVDGGEIVAAVAIGAGVDPKRTALARVDVVFANELSKAREFHNLAGMQLVDIDGV